MPHESAPAGAAPLLRQTIKIPAGGRVQAAPRLRPALALPPPPPITPPTTSTEEDLPDDDITDLHPMTAAIAAAVRGSNRHPRLLPFEAIQPGTIIANYRVLEQLANGGMGVVFRGEHLHLGREVALKFLHQHLLEDQWAVARFLAEAVATARISHPGAVSVFDYGPFEGGAYIAMEYLPGETLNARLRREGRQSISRIHDIGTQLAFTLAAAHAVGVIHRDLKPDNVYLVRTASGRDQVKVLDFGVAKLARGPGAPLTQRGDLLGTPSYMAPEQSVHAGTVDGRCDVYSLGCLLYQLATGVVPFRGSMLRVLLAHQTELPPPPRSFDPSIPPALDELILRMLSKSPDDRPAGMLEVARALSAFEPTAIPRAPSAPPPPRQVAWLGVALGLGLGAVLAGIGHLATLW